MKYMGSKNRHAKELLPILLKDRVDGQYYIEPFVGGGNLIDKVPGGFRIGSDVNPWVIQALISIRDSLDELPKNNREFTEEHYTALRKSDEYKHKGYAGFAFSYGGKWLGGWRRDSKGTRDYVAESYRNALSQRHGLCGVELICQSYEKLDIPKKSIIYCDPPYFGTTKYKDDFNHDLFWDWCREKAKAYIVNKAYPEIDVSEAFGKKLDELAAIPVLSAFEIAEVMAKFGYTESEAKRYLIKQSTTHK